MKIIALTALASSLVLMSFTGRIDSTANTTPVNRIAKTAIAWKAEELDLGEIPQGKPVQVEFEFTNTGEVPVIINSVQASCGCTTTDYAKTPVLPGEKTKIKATYNAAAKGAFKKTVTVSTNAEEQPKVLIIKGTVI